MRLMAALRDGRFFLVLMIIGVLGWYVAARTSRPAVDEINGTYRNPYARTSS